MDRPEEYAEQGFFRFYYSSRTARLTGGLRIGLVVYFVNHAFQRRSKVGPIRLVSLLPFPPFAMNLFRNLFSSSIGRKFLMAITGLVLIGFVTGHLVGNLQIFLPPDQINGYAHFLQGIGPLLWGIRLFLLACFAIHVWAAVALTLESRAARGPEAYGVKKWLKASVASRYMRLSGAVVLAFVIYHLAHFTIGIAGTETFKSTCRP